MAHLTHVPDLDQLSALDAAADHGSMSGAARALGISQQAVSARIRAAEALLGVAVFERSTRGIRPTGGGQLVLTWVREVLDAAEALESGVGALRSDGSRVRVAASNTVSECLLPVWAQSLRARHPDVALRIRPGNSEQVLDDVAAGEVDLGFVEGPRVPRTLRSQVVARDELVVVVPSDHPWARRRRTITGDELASTSLVLRESGSGTRERLEEVLPRLAPPAAVMPSAAAVRDTALALGLPCVLSSLAARPDVESGRLVVVPVSDLEVPRLIRAVWHPNQRPRGPAAELLAIAAGGQ